MTVSYSIRIGSSRAVLRAVLIYMLASIITHRFTGALTPVSQLSRTCTRSSTKLFSTITRPSDNKSVDGNAIGNAALQSEFARLGLVSDITEGLSANGYVTPTPVQRGVIPRLLGGENIVMAASTGSGKTLAYVLPIVQRLLSHEQDEGYTRMSKRPRCLILVPTRELARQVLASIKQLSHYCKVSSTAVLGGEDYSVQRRSMDRCVDVVVASPGRLLEHKHRGNVFLSQVTHVVIDEVDTMLTQGFGSDIRAILRSVTKPRKPIPDFAEGNAEGLSQQTLPPVQLTMATATLTKAVRKLLDDVDGSFNIEYSDPSNLTPRKALPSDTTIKMKIVEIDGVHRSLPHVRHDMEHVKGIDKLQVLDAVTDRYKNKGFRTMIFCNTIDSARAVDYHLNEADISADEHNILSYHGELNSKEREENLRRFRAGECRYLVCTDIAARGIDVPEIDHVIMFDFPLNPVDYIHRAGRCGRAGKKGLVTSLVAKRDQTLANAIDHAIAKGLPIDSLTSAKRDYMDFGKLAGVVGRKQKSPQDKKVPRGRNAPSKIAANKAKKASKDLSKSGPGKGSGKGPSGPKSKR